MYSKSPKSKVPRPFDQAIWRRTSPDKYGPVPQQQNGIDCGMFVITAIDYLLYELPLLYQFEDMNFFRVKLLESFLSRKDYVVVIESTDDD